MISLEQIRSLQERVHTAVSRIRTLSAENATLKERLESNEKRISELETLISAFKSDQEEIEAGIVAALRHLDELEDSVSEPSALSADTPAEAPADDWPAQPAGADEPVAVDNGAEDIGAEEGESGDVDIDEEDSGPEPELDIF